MGTLKRQSNGPIYSKTVTCTLAVDGLGCYIWYSEEVTGQTINGQCTNSYYSMWHYTSTL